MSEQILKALMHLFGIITKQGEGTTQLHWNFVKSFLTFQLASEKVQEYLHLFEKHADYSPDLNKELNIEETNKPKRTSMKDAVLIISICKQINLTLTQKQKVVVLVRILELIKTDMQFTPQRMEVLESICAAFNITPEEFKVIHSFCINENPYALESDDICIIDSSPLVIVNKEKGIRHIYTEGLDKEICVLKVTSVDLYFVKYNGKNEIFLNGLMFNNKNIYLFASGSIIRLPQGTVFYSDVVAHFISDKQNIKLTFNVKNLEYKFANGNIGFKDINISEQNGKLIAIMGASGAGKTTLLNVLSGMENPSHGEVLINGVNIHQEKQKLEGIIGYIAQDDLLIEELTVFQNLYYNAKLCFGNYTETELTKVVIKTLQNLGLYEIKDIKVGNVLNKKISGGQRKRLNIALELIREPSILFVDEPTSGLSSRDSENVMDLLKELSLRGKMIFVVIHQPSSDIFKMFDKLILLDTGGYPIYYKNPVEALIYFKNESHQINAEHGECPTCGNVNPELLFNIIEEKVLDDFGRYTDERKTKPTEWYNRFKSKFSISFFKDEKIVPEKSIKIPNKIKQLIVFIQRDVLSKISNTQYILINLLEAPILAFILSFIIKYIENFNSTTYIFRENENIPAYIFMCIIVMLFLGMMVSAEEIYRDKKLLKRESLLNLSRSSYLLSKILILFFISAIQTFLFIVIGNNIVEIKGLFGDYWLMLFSVSCFANMAGLNISSALNSAVTIYILIPLFIIPQMILGGAMFSFDKLNKTIGGGYHTPFVADLMVSRWAYEGLMVNQFANNDYQKNLFNIEKNESAANYKITLYLTELKDITEECKLLLPNKNDSAKKILSQNLTILKNEISKEVLQSKSIPFKQLTELTLENCTPEMLESTKNYIQEVSDYYNEILNNIITKKEEMVAQLENSGEYLKKYNQFYNENVADIVKRSLEKNKILRYNGTLIQLIDPIYQDSPNTFISFKTPFFIAKKTMFGKALGTLQFNLIIIWAFSIMLYIALYLDWLKKIILLGGKFFTRKQ